MTMTTIPAPAPRYSMSWEPAAARRGGLAAPRALGQQGTLGGPVVSLVASGTVAVTSAFLAWGLGRAASKWSTVWYVVAGAAAIKALHDMSRV